MRGSSISRRPITNHRICTMVPVACLGPRRTFPSFSEIFDYRRTLFTPLAAAFYVDWRLLGFVPELGIEKIVSLACAIVIASADCRQSTFSLLPQSVIVSIDLSSNFASAPSETTLSGVSPS